MGLIFLLTVLNHDKLMGYAYYACYVNSKIQFFFIKYSIHVLVAFDLAVDM